MENDPQKPFEGADWSGWGRWSFSQRWRWALIRDPGAGLFVTPFIYVPAVISGDRFILAVVTAAWVLAQLSTSLTVFLGETAGDPRPAGGDFWRAAAGQTVGLVPWLVLALAWSALTTAAIILLIPALAGWGLACFVWSTGQGAGFAARLRNSPYRDLWTVFAGILVFAGFVLGLVMLIKASHPLR